MFVHAAEESHQQEEGQKKLSLTFHDYCLHDAGAEEGISVDMEDIEEGGDKHHKGKSNTSYCWLPMFLKFIGLLTIVIHKLWQESLIITVQLT